MKGEIISLGNVAVKNGEAVIEIRVRVDTPRERYPPSLFMHPKYDYLGDENILGKPIEEFIIPKICEFQTRGSILDIIKEVKKKVKKSKKDFDEDELEDKVEAYIEEYKEYLKTLKERKSIKEISLGKVEVTITKAKED